MASDPASTQDGPLATRSLPVSRSVDEVLRSPGQPLDAQMRAFMEPRFGHDFSKVRVHTDAKAAKSARSMNARAYTVGNNVVFGSGEYASKTSAGRWLLTHELAHTVQQASSQGKVPDKIMDNNGSLEREAILFADSAVAQNDPIGKPGHLSNSHAVIQRFPSGALDGQGENKQTPESAGTPLNIEFNAFIPGALGHSFESFPHPRDLKNQAAFEASLNGVPGSWLKEPGSFSDNDTSPWYFATDNRSFGGGRHRLGFRGKVERPQIGSLKNVPNVFVHNTSGSEHVRWKHTGYLTSKGETGSVEGPFFASAKPSSSEQHSDNAPGESTIQTNAAANYPFKVGSPDIDYSLTFSLKQDTGGKTRLRFEITKNLFPFYELLINGGIVWKYSAIDPGPTISNLTSSDTFKSGDWSF